MLNFAMAQEQAGKLPAFKSKEMQCTLCQATMFYSEENLVHVCLKEEHGILCYFEPDSCWFAAKEETALELGRRGIKFHFIPKNVFENSGLGTDFKCEYSESDSKKENTAVEKADQSASDC